MTGSALGVATIKYSLPTGCAATANVTVDPVPTAFTVGGGGSYCAGLTAPVITLSGSQTGVTYTEYIGGAATAITMAGTGAGLNFGPQTTPGVYTIVGKYATGCSTVMTGSQTISVNPVPVISGASALCVATFDTLSASIAGGTWTIGVASPVAGGVLINPITGVVTGSISGDSALVTYRVSATGCAGTKEIHVSPSPTAITGPATVCVADSVMFTNSVTGGTWTSSPTIFAIASPFSGYVSGVSAGVATITYSLGAGCQRFTTVTVNPAPAPISPISPTICQNGTVSLTDATFGGTWSVDAGSASLATISATGVVRATLTGGTTATVATILYAAPVTGCKSWSNVNINPLPAPISGVPIVCAGSSRTLSDASTGGSWSISGLNATIGTYTGLLTGVTVGTSSIVTYTALGCITSQIVTVNGNPSITTTAARVCEGQTTTIIGTPAGGIWTSTIGSITSAGVLSGGSSTGSGTVTYSLGSGCSQSIPVTVLLSPTPILGITSSCAGGSAPALSDATPGGTWSSSNPLIASISSGGLVTTSSTLTGPVTISYTVGTCPASTIYNVLGHPGIIRGSREVCVRSNTTLTDDSLGGIWSSANPALATISPTGVVTGISAGTVIISYGSAGCPTVMPLVVNPMSPILGDSVICVGQSTGLVDTTLGGIWITGSADVSVSSAGVMTGVIAGVGSVEYLVPATGCTTTKAVTVNALPSPILGVAALCVGQSSHFVDASAGGIWSSSNSSIGSVDASGNVTGVSGGAVVISYANSATGCAATFALTINALPSAIAGPSNVCLGSTMTLTDSVVGAWSSSATAIASVTTAGVVTGVALGSATITLTSAYTLCSVNKTVNVVNGPTGIYGTASLCEGTSLYLYDTSGTGTWTSSAPSTASVDATSGLVIGLFPGLATISYSVGSGCAVTKVVTVNTAPSGLIGGSTNICVGSPTTFISHPGGGVWSSSSAAVDSVGAGTYLGVAPGSATITYTLSDGCFTNTTVIVNAGPDPITGFPQVCVGQTTSLADASVGGTWSSSSPAYGTVDGSGTVTGIIPGVTTISYTVPTSICPSIQNVTVNPLPSVISGTMVVCEGQNITLHDLVSGGTWTSGATSNATVDSVTGVVTGVAAGVAPIMYTLGAGCFATAMVTVNAVPSAIIGLDSLCQGQSIVEYDPTGSGAWSSSATSVATINTGGVLTGVHSGVTNISYTVAGCSATQSVTVDVQPTAIIGNTNVCLGGTSALSDAVAGGIWSTTASGIASVSTSGVLFGSSLGSTVVTYAIYPGACNVTAVVNVLPLPTQYNVTGGGNLCAGGTGVPVNLSNSAVGVNYLLYRSGVTATGTFAGTGAPLNFGLQTVAGIYTVIGISTATGCSIAMDSSAVVSVTPNVIPEVSVNATPGTTVCTGTTVSYAPVATYGGSAPAYQWRINGTAVGTSPTYSYLPANGDVVSVKLTSNYHCASPDTAGGSLVMTVSPFTNPSVTIKPEPNDTVCQGSRVTLVAMPSYAGTAPTYTWLINGVVAGTGPTHSFVPNNLDVAGVIMSSSYACRLSTIDTSANLVMSVVNPVMPVVTITASPGYIVGGGQPVTMTATVVNGGTSPTYQWFVNGFIIPTATSSSYTTTSLTHQSVDSVSCQVTASGTCSETGVNWVFIQIANVGVSQVSGSGDIMVVPNPNKGDFTIKGSLGVNTNQEVAVELTNVLGQVVYKNTITAIGGKLNEHITVGASLANGMYVLSLRSDAGSKIVHMVIEQ